MTADHTTADQPDGLRPILEQFRKQCVNKGGGAGFEQTIVDLEALLRRHVLTAQIELLEQLDACPHALVYVGIGDRLAALRDELAGLEGEK
jgi:hypothetical protein